MLVIIKSHTNPFLSCSSLNVWCFIKHAAFNISRTFDNTIRPRMGRGGTCPCLFQPVKTFLASKSKPPNLVIDFFQMYWKNSCPDNAILHAIFGQIVTFLVFFPILTKYFNKCLFLVWRQLCDLFSTFACNVWSHRCCAVIQDGGHVFHTLSNFEAIPGKFVFKTLLTKKKNIKRPNDT